MDSVRTEASFRDLFERAPVGYAVSSADGSLRAVNIACARMLHRASDLLEGVPLAVFVAEEDRPALLECLANARSGESRNWRLPVHMETASGACRAVVLHGAAIHDKDGDLTEVRWVLIDRRREAQQQAAVRRGADRLRRQVIALEQQVEMLRRRLGEEVEGRVRLDAVLAAAEMMTESLAEHATTGVLRLDRAGRIRTCNRSAGRLLGRDAVDLVGAELEKVMPGDGTVGIVGRRPGRYAISGEIVLISRH